MIGNIHCNAEFFRLSEITEEDARQGGMLSRAKGQGGFALGRNTSDGLYALFRAEKITEGNRRGSPKIQFRPFGPIIYEKNLPHLHLWSDFHAELSEPPFPTG